jgi:hypothetical protein
VREFVLRQFAATASTPELQTADRCGYTADEVQALKAPLPAHSFKRLQFAMTRLSINTLGRLSDGVRIGLRTGFVRPAAFGTARGNGDFPRATNTPGGSALFARTFLMSFGLRF